MNGAWCPFNSQNTTFFRKVFPLLYLPAHCSFRMTDIWRSFVAQRILHHLGHPVLFHEATVWQERNDHCLHRDFLDEVPGYQNNHAIREALIRLDFEAVGTLLRMPHPQRLGRKGRGIARQHVARGPCETRSEVTGSLSATAT